MSRTALIPERQPLFLPMGCSVVLHVGAVVGVLAARGAVGLLVAILPWCNEAPEPLIKPDIEVSMVSLPRRLDVPDRAARVKRAAGEVPTKPDEPPPVKESELVIHEDKPEPKKGNTPEPVERPDAAAQRTREALLDELLNAPEGTMDRNATDPDGTGTAELAALGAQAIGDAAFARWKNQVQAILDQKFQPLGSSSGLLVHAELRIEPSTGRILSYDLSKKSGVMAYDAAAERAIASVGALPVPPEKYWPLLEVEFVTIRLKR
ncbi:MAG TPA: hypothetical protein ENK18_25345 [Deltaproteobacteria bacterium]|nr:hypothetical protein [Deltaproteobacteria bacterium]